MDEAKSFLDCQAMPTDQTVRPHQASTTPANSDRCDWSCPHAVQSSQAQPYPSQRPGPCHEANDWFALEWAQSADSLDIAATTLAKGFPPQQPKLLLGCSWHCGTWPWLPRSGKLGRSRYLKLLGQVQQHQPSRMGRQRGRVKRQDGERCPIRTLGPMRMMDGSSRALHRDSHRMGHPHLQGHRLAHRCELCPALIRGQSETRNAHCLNGPHKELVQVPQVQEQPVEAAYFWREALTQALRFELPRCQKPGACLERYAAQTHQRSRCACVACRRCLDSCKALLAEGVEDPKALPPPRRRHLYHRHGLAVVHEVSQPVRGVPKPRGQRLRQHCPEEVVEVHH